MASADRVVINNGLAPPFPDNILDHDAFANDVVYIRNVGCGDLLAYAYCPNPGDPTASEMVEGGKVSSYYVFDTSTITMLGGQVSGQMQAMDSAEIIVRNGSIGNYLAALGTSTVSLYSGNVGRFLHAGDHSVLSWYGGSVGGRLEADDDSILNVFGHDFRVDGKPVPPGPIEGKWYGGLTGTLASGEPFGNFFIHGASPVSGYQGTIVLHVVFPPMIDIKPRSDRNRIHLSRRGSIRVAILGSSSFDVEDVDVTTLGFGPNGIEPKHDLTVPKVFFHHLRDVDRDGYTDLMMHYRIQDVGFSIGDTEACLSGRLVDGTGFEGCDSVWMFGKWGARWLDRWVSRLTNTN
jgi:hypothetical protein